MNEYRKIDNGRSGKKTKNYILISLAFFIPILVLSLHLISNEWIINIKLAQPNIINFFGIIVEVIVIYDLVLFLIFGSSLLIILLMFSFNKKN